MVGNRNALNVLVKIVYEGFNELCYVMRIGTASKHRLQEIYTPIDHWPS